MWIYVWFKVPLPVLVQVVWFKGIIANDLKIQINNAS